jgi:glycosyltransferase involved in cell wall biosynthesis
LIEALSLLRQRRGLDPQQIMHLRNQRFQQSISTQSLTAASVVIGYDTASWILAARCAKLSIPLILDQSTCHPDAKLAVYTLVRERYPSWNEEVGWRLPEVREAEQREHEMAARIVVGSSFVRSTLVAHGVPPGKTRVNPYGVDCDRFTMQPRGKSSPLRFVFVGAMNSRKGVPLLLDAWRELGNTGAELWLIGSGSKRAVGLLPTLARVRYFGRLPREEVAKLLPQCDVFVFPSFFEGLALVMLEAMASGLPVIATSSSGGGDIITEGEDGWVIEPGNLPALVARMNHCLEQPATVRDMGRQARATAERFSWSAYGDRWMQILSEVCDERGYS